MELVLAMVGQLSDQMKLFVARRLSTLKSRSLLVNHIFGEVKDLIVLIVPVLFLPHIALLAWVIQAGIELTPESITAGLSEYQLASCNLEI